MISQGLTLLVGLASLASGCGVGVHLTLFERTQNFMPEVVRQNHQQAQAGAFFPDAFYSCAGLSDAAEDAHWPPFMKTAVDYWHEKYGNTLESGTNPGWLKQKLLGFKTNAQVKADGDRLKAFIYGMLTHQVSDVSWHSLGLHQGLLRMLADAEFDGDVDAAHKVLDPGGDMIMVRRLLNSGLDTSWINGESWDWPSGDIIEIFNRAGWKVNTMSLGFCMVRGRAALAGEIGVAKAAFIPYAIRTPTLVDQIEDYYLGGATEMTMAIRHCTTNLDRWFANGTPENPWELCEVFDGRAPRKPVHHDTIVTIESDGEVPHERSRIQGSSDQNPTILTTGMTESQFGSSIAFGEFVDEPCVAIGAPYESFVSTSKEELPKGGVYVIKQSQLASAQIASTALGDKNRINSASAEYKYNERFGAHVSQIKMGDDVADVLAVSRPGISQIEFFVASQALAQVKWGDSHDGYGASGIKIVGETMHASDLDGDGLDELIIGAPRNDVKGRPQMGQVFIIPGTAVKQMLLSGIGKPTPPQFDIENVVGTVLETPERLPSVYSRFGTKLAAVGPPNDRVLLVGAPGDNKVYGFKWDQHVFTLNRDEVDNGTDKPPVGDFGGALLTTGEHNGTNYIAVGNSVQDIGSCSQCGSVYLFSYRNNQANQLSKIENENGASFDRFGKEGVCIGHSVYTVSSHANNERGMMWRVDLGHNATDFETLVDEGPKPWGNGFGTSISGKQIGNKTMIVVGMPHYSSQTNLLQGAAAVYMF